MSRSIGLIGLGLVGTALAEGLLAKGFEVLGLDMDSAKCAELEKWGGKTTRSTSEVAEAAQRIILSLPDTNVVVDVVGEILEASTKPTYVIDTTTGDPDKTAALARRLADVGIDFLDAPFSGSSEQLRRREVVFMIGGKRPAYEACSDIFEALSDKVFYLGEFGSGSKAKLASNLVLGLNRLALAEGLVFAGKLGLELESFLKLLKVTPAYSAAMDVKGAKMLSGDFKPQARLAQHCKDVEIMLEYGRKLGQDLPMSKTHRDVLLKAIGAGDGDLDNSAVIREIERRAL
ncbi:MAG: NAD(P)-dependent oxidoreductase [Planctomycetota bacterium]|jgi:3-hydroxyisobutyrate dehydrogenase-like beta-hydroxyacid dehydrogenase